MLCPELNECMWALYLGGELLGAPAIPKHDVRRCEVVSTRLDQPLRSSIGDNKIQSKILKIPETRNKMPKISLVFFKKPEIFWASLTTEEQ